VQHKAQQISVGRLVIGLLLFAAAGPVMSESPLDAEAALLPATTLNGSATLPGAAPTAAYPAAFLRPTGAKTRLPRTIARRTSIPADASTAAAAAAFAEAVPAQDSDSLAARLKAMEDMGTLWDNDGAKIFVGLDDDGHPGIHITNKE